MYKMNKKVRFNTNLDSEILKKMKDLAYKEGRSLNYYIEECFKFHLEKKDFELK